MSDQSGGPPAWLPASVGAAGRHGQAHASWLADGRAWGQLLASLQSAAARLSGPDVPGGAEHSGYRHLLVLLALGVDEALRRGDPARPQLRPGNVDDVLKWGMDCPDAAYSGAPVRGGGTYRVHGRRGSVRYLGFQVMAGMATTANVVADELELGPDGSLELLISPGAPATDATDATDATGNWMPLADEATSLVVRQFFYDWENEEPATLTIECLEPPPRASDDEGEPVEVSPGDVLARQIVALGAFVDDSVRFWWDIEKAGRGEGGQGLNRFREPAARTDMGGAAENVSVWGSWELGADEALLVEVVPPPARYWSVALGNQWWETLDYAHHQTSLNGHQAVVDSDGTFRAVVAHRDPGVANWLDTTGEPRGPMIFRWLRAGEAPVPATRVVRVDELDRVLPPSTSRVTPEQRREILDRRRAGVRRRFPR